MASPGAPNDCTATLAAARTGSAEALGTLFTLYRPELLEIANAGLSGDLRAKVGASDVVQESLLEAQRDFPSFAGNSDAELFAWLRRIVDHNLANTARHFRGVQKRSLARELRQREDGPVAEPESRLPSPSGESIARETAEAIERAMARLPDDYRQVIALRYHEQLAFAEIAGRMGRPLSAIRKLWARAVERLQAEMDAPHGSA
jgi:RNA polymerase sigma-70 factor, ECF subfamily